MSITQWRIAALCSPVANAKIKRSINWNEFEKPQEYYFETDAAGRLSILACIQLLKISELTQYVAKARLQVEYKGEVSELWYEVIMDASPEPIVDTHKLICEFGIDVQRVYSPPGLLGKTCRWQGMLEEEDPYTL